MRFECPSRKFVVSKTRSRHLMICRKLTRHGTSAPKSEEFHSCMKMSCNGCRVLRKGCSETCILRPCLQWIESPEAQGHATVFVAKFFGRAGLMGFISAVPENQRPALFQSLLYEACGRTVNPVHGAVGLLWTGNWNVCQAAVETVLKGGALLPATSFPSSWMQSPTVRCQSATQRSMHRIASETVATTQTAPELSISTARCNEGFGTKRPATESPSDEAERGTAAACFLNEKALTIKRHRNSERDVKGEAGSDRAAAWAPKLESVQDPIFSRLPSQPEGLLFAPVARRILPHADEAVMSQPLRLQASEGMVAGNAENIGLDLTLNSNPMALSGRMRLGSARVSSPSTLSVNSEGSVTSLDCSERSIARWPARTRPCSPRKERQLLHLLL